MLFFQNDHPSSSSILNTFLTLTTFLKPDGRAKVSNHIDEARLTDSVCVLHVYCKCAHAYGRACGLQLAMHDLVGPAGIDKVALFSRIIFEMCSN